MVKMFAWEYFAIIENMQRRSVDFIRLVRKLRRKSTRQFQNLESDFHTKTYFADFSRSAYNASRNKNSRFEFLASRNE